MVVCESVCVVGLDTTQQSAHSAGFGCVWALRDGALLLGSRDRCTVVVESAVSAIVSLHLFIMLFIIHVLPGQAQGARARECRVPLPRRPVGPSRL